MGKTISKQEAEDKVEEYLEILNTKYFRCYVKYPIFTEIEKLKKVSLLKNQVIFGEISYSNIYEIVAPDEFQSKEIYLKVWRKYTFEFPDSWSIKLCRKSNLVK